MIKYKTKKEKVKYEKSYICDVCGLEHKLSNVDDTEEFIHIKHSCGYGSIFEDESDYEIDICQVCMQKLFGREFIMKRLRRENV